VTAARWIVLATLCAWPEVVAAQQPDQVDVPDLIRTLLKRPAVSTNQSPDTVETSILPTVSYNPAFGFGLGAVYSASSRRAGETSGVSSVQASAAFTTQKQLLTAVRADIGSRNDRWRLLGDARFYKGLQRTYGLGSDTPEEPSVLLDYYLARTYATFYRSVAGPLRLGAGYHLDYYAGIKPNDREEIDGAGTTASGVSANALIDTRDNALNASRGVYARASYYAFPESLGSDSSWQASQFEGRAYAALPSARRQILAFWAMAWLTESGEPPYFNLPSVGWDTYGRSARGYAAGRFRGRDWIYTEAEYRVDLLRNGFMGAVGFINTSRLSDENGVYGSWAPGGGGGLRFKLNKRHGTNIAMDVGFGRGSNGIWFGLNEAF
jgi:hypothetical protein